jgi:hypothetical protein
LFGADGLEVSVWDTVARMWVTPPNLTNGYQALADPARFVGPQNEVRVRLRNASPMVMWVTTADVTLSFGQ